MSKTYIMREIDNRIACSIANIFMKYNYFHIIYVNKKDLMDNYF